MPIRHYLQGHRFEAEMVRLLGIAYEMALVALHQNRRIDALRAAVALNSSWRKLASATRSGFVTEL
jgi:hypothetical protein